jgi:hypothetical protein
MPLAPEVAHALLATTLGTALLLLVAAAFLWWWIELRINSIEKQWERRLADTQAGVLEIRKLLGEIRERSIGGESGLAESLAATQAQAQTEALQIRSLVEEVRRRWLAAETALAGNVAAAEEGLRADLSQVRKLVEEAGAKAEIFETTMVNRAAAAQAAAQSEAAQTRSLVEEARDRAVSAETSASNSALAVLSAIRAAELGAQSSGQSALAAAQTANALQAVAESGRRAWVHAVDYRLTLKTQPAENSSLEISVSNLGATPARDLRVFTDFLVADGVPEDLTLKPRVSSVVLGPGVSFSLSHFLRVSPADLASITTGRKIILACGRAQYSDVFGVDRETHWCARYDYFAKTFVPSDKHNLTI